MTLTVNTRMGSYPIYIERGLLDRVAKTIALEGRRVCIVTDSGVPDQYVQTVAHQLNASLVFCFAQGEQNKNFDTLRKLLDDLLALHFDRKDAIVALGGGVVTDLAGFAASIYMRGIDFYNIPTTLLSQVDASVGGKTAVDFDGYKNMIGSFWQPKAVLIDPLTLNTLPRRRISDGLAEVIKMALTSDASLFERIEASELLPPSDAACVPDEIDEIIAGALKIKIRVVEKDEREAGLRRVLNFGHTLGHAIESCSGLCDRYHGECVALGMLPMCSDEVRNRLIPVLKQNSLPYALDGIPSDEQLLCALKHDKKADGDTINAVFVERVGSFVMREQTPNALIDLLVQTAKSMR